MNIAPQEWKSVRSSHFFRTGKKSKRTNRINNPGILCYDTKYEMVKHKFNKKGTKATYLCKYRIHPLYKCKAKLTIINCKEKEEEDKWVILTPKEEIVHSCKPNKLEYKNNSKPLLKDENQKRPKWYKNSCRSCCHRFNIFSEVARCKDCDHFIHVKTSCSSTSDNLVGDLFCKICKPKKKIQGYETEEDTLDYIKRGLHYQCVHCEFKTTRKFSIHRHVIRKHCLEASVKSRISANETMQEASTSRALEDIGPVMSNCSKMLNKNTSQIVILGNADLSLQPTTKTNVPNQDMKDAKGLENIVQPTLALPETVFSILTKLNLKHLYGFFQNEDIDMEVLQTMSPMELKLLGMKYGPAKKITIAIQECIKINKT